MLPSENQYSLSDVGSFLRTFDLVFLIAGIWFMVQFLRYVFPPLFGTFQDLYGVSNTQTGALFTLLMLGYSAMQFPAGWLSDRLDEVTVIVAGVGAFTAAAVFTAFAPTFVLLTVAAVGIGVGTGVHKTVAIPYLSKTYPERTGLALGVMDTIGQFGGMAAPIVVVALIASALPWSSVFVIGAVVSAGIGAVFYRRARRHRVDTLNISDGRGDVQPESEKTRVSSKEYAAVFSNRKLLVFIVVTVLFTFAWNGLSAFFPLFLSNEKGLSAGMAGFAYSLLFAASMSQMVTGVASDRRGRLGISLLLFGLMAFGIVTLLVVESIVLLLLLTVVTGIGFHGFRPVRDSYLMELIPESLGGGALGIIRTAMTIIGALAPATIGFLTDQVGYIPAFGLIAVFLVVGGILIAFLR
jgi:MFS family permease